MVIVYWQYVRSILGGVTNLYTAVGFFSKLRFHTSHFGTFGPEVTQTHTTTLLTSLILEARTVQHRAGNPPGILHWYGRVWVRSTAQNIGKKSKATRGFRKQHPILQPCAMHKTLKSFSHNRGCLCPHS